MKPECRVLHVVIMVGLLWVIGCRQQDDSESEGTYDVVITAVVDGRKILAIKGVREVTGLGVGGYL